MPEIVGEKVILCHKKFDRVTTNLEALLLPTRARIPVEASLANGNIDILIDINSQQITFIIKKKN